MLPHIGGIPSKFWLKRGISCHSEFSIKKYRRRANDNIQSIEDIAHVSNIVLQVETTKGHEVISFVLSLETSPGILYLFPHDNDFKPMLSRTTESPFSW